MSRPRKSYEERIFRLTLLSGLPAVLVALGPLWFLPHAPKVVWTLTLLVLGSWLGLAWRVRRAVWLRSTAFQGQFSFPSRFRHWRPIRQVLQR